MTTQRRTVLWTSLLGAMITASACSSCGRTPPPQEKAPTATGIVDAMARPTQPLVVMPAEFVPPNSTPALAAKKHPVLVAPTTEVFGLHAAPLPAPHRSPVIRLPEMVVESTPAPKKKAPAPMLIPLPAGARVSIEESNEELADFRLEKVEYFLNGEPVDIHREDFFQTASVFDGATQTGENLLVVRATARGVPVFPFVYLKDVTFVREIARTFTAHQGDHVTIATIVSSDGNLLKQMRDRLHVNVGISVVPRQGVQVGWR